jgi:putative tricarboxylic transport membrane protein
VLFDITGFLQGIGFLVLAIGVYGIGEMLWTIEQSRGEVETTTPKMTVKGMASDTKEGCAAAGRAR